MLLKEMTVKIITEQDAETIESLVRERLFGFADVSEISSEIIDPDWNNAHNKHKDDCSKCPLVDHCDESIIKLDK